MNKFNNEADEGLSVIPLSAEFEFLKKSQNPLKNICKEISQMKSLQGVTILLEACYEGKVL